MEYRRLGRSGVKVSQLSFGSWVTFGKQLDMKEATKSLSVARDYGVNFFDNAEVYANGQSEEIMGAAIKELNWPRLSYLISTKFFWGITDDINGKNTLNRKYLHNAITASLKRLQLDYVDLVYCHRPDPNTPIEETVWAMHDMIQKGYALYWGTSEWSAEEIRAAYDIAERHHLHKPVVEQPQYNLFHRKRVEVEYQRLYEDFGLGLTIWSPLASGILTGKYLEKIPEGSRLSMQSLSWLAEEALADKKKKQVQQLVAIAKDLKVTPAALAIAWCTKNPFVSSVITGASRIEQIHDNLKALEVLPKLSDDVMLKLNEAFPVLGA
jgi:voltage-dependent potassium channel beta subunit